MILMKLMNTLYSVQDDYDVTEHTVQDDDDVVNTLFCTVHCTVYRVIMMLHEHSVLDDYDVDHVDEHSLQCKDDYDVVEHTVHDDDYVDDDVWTIFC